VRPASTRSPAARLARAAGAGLAVPLGLLARLRRGKPIHPRGAVHDVAVHRRGARDAGRPWGAPWLDEPGSHTGLVRFSRAVGLPRPLPDVLGLAVRFATDDGTHDLLLASTGLGRASRYLLLPRRRPDRTAYTSVMPYRTPRGPVLLAAVPALGAPASPGTRVLRFTLAAATPLGAWEPLGALEVTGWGECSPAEDAPVAFDPVPHPLPGLAVPAVVAGVRAPGYAAARRGRDGGRGRHQRGGRGRAVTG